MCLFLYKPLPLKGRVGWLAKRAWVQLDIESMVAKDIEEIKEEQEDGSEKIISTFNNKEKWEKEYPEWISLTYDALGIISASSTHALWFCSLLIEVFMRKWEYLQMVKHHG